MTHWDPERNLFGQFIPGSGGRPRGARNLAGRKLREVWEKSMGEHVEDTIDEVRQKDPSGYLRLLMRVVPTPIEDEVEPYEHLTPEELDQKARAFCAMLIEEGYGPGPEGPWLAKRPRSRLAPAADRGVPGQPSSEFGGRHEIDISDLDPADIARWTEWQAARCEWSGMFERLTEEQRRQFESRRGRWRRP